MNIAFIKKTYENMPYWMKTPFTKIIRKRLIGNQVFFETYQRLNGFDKLSDDEKDENCKAYLKDILIHAYEHTAYYNRIFHESGFDPYEFTDYKDLSLLPVLNKELLKSNYAELEADDVTDFYEVSTGGTSGKPIHVLMEGNAIYREWAFVYHYWSKFGYDYHTSKLATFRGVDFHGREYEINPLYQEIRLNPMKMNRNNITKYDERIRRYGADFLYGYPSAIYNFCRLAEQAGINLAGRFKAVLLISENLYYIQKNLIERVTKSPIALFYGHSERAVFAEGFDDGYIFQKCYGHTEIDSHGQPVVSGFVNRKMPLIRYVVDDQVELQSNGKYTILGHHDSEVLYGLKGEQISVAAINFHDDTFEFISGYQFVQEEIGQCELRVTSDNLVPDTELDKIKNRITVKLGDGITCTVKIVDQLELTKRGKYKMLIQHCKVEI